MRVIGYRHVPGGQPSFVQQPDDEENILHQWCQHEGHTLVGIERDRVRSRRRAPRLAGELARRPGLCRAIVAVEHGRVDWLAMTEATQWVIGSLVTMVIAHQLGRRDGSLVVVSDDDVEFPQPADQAEQEELLADELVREMLTTLVVAVLDYDQALQPARQAAAPPPRRRTTGRAAGGAPAYGQRLQDHQLVADPREQAAIARARQLQQQGRSLRQIAEVLAAEGHRPKRGRHWHPTTVARLLHR